MLIKTCSLQIYIYVVQDVNYESVSSINKFVIMVNQHYFSMKKNVLQIEIII